ncbi:MAG TPA: carboxypeptidase regulatory-like domain-containing protein [Planctomycetota bacterium]|nr:carboxypeptidase regulatory-like domain-containing protein [Planctomycetota bacterium]
MLARLSLGLLLAALLLGAWLFLDAEREPRAVRAGASSTVAGPAPDDGPRGLGAPRAADARSAPVAAAPESTSARRSAAVEDVRILVRLEPSDLAQGWGGDWHFELQTWDERRDKVELHSHAADAAGLAEFRFVGPVHVDWARVVPPESSGRALAFVEEHIDLAQGDEHEIVLAPGPGGLLEGRVQDLHGRPATGVRVHAYFEDSSSDLADWQPGLVTAESDASGRFHFPRLPKGQWGLCVEPGDWLAYRPPTGEVERGWNAIDVRDDTESEARLIAVRAEHFTLRVVDAAGAPVEAASVRLEPLQLLGGRMLLEHPERPDPLVAFLGGGVTDSDADAWIWPHGTLANWTRANGEVRLVGVPGVWDLSVWGPLDASNRAPPALRHRFELPAPDLVWTLDARFEHYRGRVLDESGAPLPDVWVVLRERGLPGVLSTQRSDGDGRFEFSWLRPGASYELELRRTGWLARGNAFAPTPEGEPAEDLVLRRGLDVELQFTTPSGVLSLAQIEIVSLQPDDSRPEESPAVEALLRSPRRRTDGRGLLRLHGVPASELVLGLRRRIAVLDGEGRAMVDAFGRSRSEDPVVHTWRLRVPPAEQLLEVDVSAWPEPEPPELARHGGRVVDATSGAPIAGAQVFVHAQEGFRTAHCDVEGRFELLGLFVPYELHVRADGYAATTLATRKWAPMLHEHEFALRPGDDRCLIVLVDRKGERLPTVQVRLIDTEGRPRRVLTRTEDGYLRFAEGAEAREGNLDLIGVPPGQLELELALKFPPLASLGRCRVLVADTTQAQTLVARLDRSLDELREELRAVRNAELVPEEAPED